MPHPTLNGVKIEAMDGRVYLLDTSVLLHDASALEEFDNRHVVLTVDVLEELDRFKRESDERGRNARQVIRTLDQLRGEGDLREGVPLPAGGRLFVLVDDYVDHLPRGLDGRVPDNRILAATLFLKKNDVDVVFVTKDINARVKGDALGIPAEDYRASKVNFDELYSGWSEIEVSAGEVDGFYEARESAVRPEGRDFQANEGVLLRDRTQPKHTALGIYDSERRKIVPMVHQDARPWGIQALNLQQHFALELLLRDDIQLVTMLGQAGTGKTLLALAAGLHKVADEKIYRRMMVSRPIIPLGRDIGYLPGTKEEKLESWMEPVYDNLQYLVDPQMEEAREKVEYLFHSEMIEIEAVTYIRGRSLPKLFILIDEAQNLTPHEVKTAISRAGKGTKVVLTGDAYQIDNPYLDASSNGLTYVVERFKGQHLYGHITLARSERSTLASLAAELL